MSTVAVPDEASTAVGSSSAPDCQSTIQTGDLVVDLNTRLVSVDGKPVHLTGKEFGILKLLSLRKGATVTKDMFLTHLYGGGAHEPELKIIDIFVCNLRKKLAQATGGNHYIETIWGRGYVLREPAPPNMKPLSGSRVLLRRSSPRRSGAAGRVTGGWHKMDREVAVRWAGRKV